MNKHIEVDFNEIYGIINYKFKDENLLRTALTHPSFCSSKSNKCTNYQKLELLGDSVLSLIVIEMLMDHYNDLSEGEIAKRKSSLVCTESLSKIGRKLNIGKFIIMSNGEDSMGGRNNANIIEDIMEAIIGAMYIDGGLESARKFINTNWEEDVLDRENFKGDPKTRLQQWTQKYKNTLPKYNLIGTERGDNHINIFEFEVLVNQTMPIFSAKDTTKKGAEVKAAIKMIKYIKDNINDDI